MKNFKRFIEIDGGKTAHDERNNDNCYRRPKGRVKFAQHKGSEFAFFAKDEQ